MNGYTYRCLLNAYCSQKYSSSTVSLTIRPLDTSVANSNNTLNANQTGATYQWLDCNNNYAAFAGATSQVFKPTVNESYAVQITFNNCTDTSSCYNISNVGIGESYIPVSLVIYPNPFSNQTIIMTDIQLNNATLQILNDTGQEVKEINGISGNKITLSRDNLPNGVYFMHLSQDNKVITSKKLLIAD